MLVCLATIFWCFWLMRRSVYDTLDRFLLGFIGLLAIYQGLRLLREIGLVTLFSNGMLNNVVELTVAMLYLLSVLIMRLSSEQRQYSDFQVRSARAEPRNSLQLPARNLARALAAGHSNFVTIEQQLLHIAELVPVLTDPAFKLYIYLSTRIDPATSCACVDEEVLTALRKNSDEISLLLKELEGQGVCRLRNDVVTKSITVQVISPWRGSGPTGSETSIDSLLALEGQLSASVRAEQKGRAMAADSLRQ